MQAPGFTHSVSRPQPCQQPQQQQHEEEEVRSTARLISPPHPHYSFSLPRPPLPSITPSHPPFPAALTSVHPSINQSRHPSMPFLCVPTPRISSPSGTFWTPSGFLKGCSDTQGPLRQVFKAGWKIKNTLIVLLLHSLWMNVDDSSPSSLPRAESFFSPNRDPRGYEHCHRTGVSSLNSFT